MNSCFHHHCRGGRRCSKLWGLFRTAMHARPFFVPCMLTALSSCFQIPVLIVPNLHYFQFFEISKTICPLQLSALWWRFKLETWYNTQMFILGQSYSSLFSYKLLTTLPGPSRTVESRLNIVRQFIVLLVTQCNE